MDDLSVLTGSYNWTLKARLNDENIIIIKEQPEIASQFNEKFESIKPQYGFGFKGNEVKLLPIEEIMRKWDKQKESRPPVEGNKIKSISDKF